MCGTNMANLESAMNLKAFEPGSAFHPHSARRGMAALLFMFTAFLMFSLQEVFASEIWLGDWLQTNNPRVIKYLTNLRPANIGKEVSGIELSDGSIVLDGHKYLGAAVGLGKGVHAHILSHKQKQYAYIWIDPAGEKLLLPDCSKSDPEITGNGSYVLSGDIYTSKYVQPGDGLVVNECPSKSWLTAIPSSKKKGGRFSPRRAQ